MTIIVTGGRDFEDRDFVMSVLMRMVMYSSRIAVGCCKTGLDAIVRKEFPNHHKEYKADWTKWGLPAGPMRNGAMLKDNMTGVLIAFPGNKGTRDCMSQARKLGIPVLEVRP